MGNGNGAMGNGNGNGNKNRAMGNGNGAVGNGNRNGTRHGKGIMDRTRSLSASARQQLRMQNRAHVSPGTWGVQSPGNSLLTCN